MTSTELLKMERRLEGFLEDLVRPMGRSERRRWASLYVRGLLLDGDRKSVDPIALRTGGDAQALRQFLNDSPWEVELVEQKLADKLKEKLPRPLAWPLDETSFPKAGSHSVGVARQYCGARGKLDNCQVAVTLHYATEEMSCPVCWRLFLSKEWIEDAARRRKAKVPKETRFLTKNELAAEAVAQALSFGLPKAPVVADAAYGCDFFLREKLRELGCDYVMALNHLTKVWREDPGPLPAKERAEALDLHETARALCESDWKRVEWREGSKGAMRSRFALLKVWAAKGAKGGRAPKKRVAEWLLIEWPKKEEKPVNYWLGFFQDGREPRLKEIVVLAKARWRIEQDYRELKEELGLDHFEGRGWPGWHHHVTLVSLAYAFLRFEQLRGKKSRDEDLAHGPPRPAGGAHPHGRLLPMVRNQVPQLLLST